MNRFLVHLLLTPIAALFLLVIPATPALASDIATAQPGEDRVRFLVQWQRESGIASLPEMTYATHAASISPLDWQIVEVDAAHADALYAQLQNDPTIAALTVDYPLEITVEVNDPAFQDGTQWALGTVGAGIAWEFTSGQAITVAIVDSGIDPTHPDLVGQLVEGYDFVSNVTQMSDPCGHGTHVAGIVAAIADNGIGGAGIAPGTRLMPVRVIGDTCTGTYSRLIQGILYAVDHGAQVIVITSGATFEHNGLRDALRYAREHNVLVVASAGNRGTDVPFYPGSFEEAFTVAGTDQDDGRYLSSTHGSQIDVSAPATSIFSTYSQPGSGPTYAHMTGTSMSAPLVAGIAALLLSLDPALSLEDLETVLRESADDLGEPGWDQYYGWGRINAWRAVATVGSAAGNVKPGNVRIPVLHAFESTFITTSVHSQGIEVAWNVASPKTGATVVIYRAPVPVFEASTYIAEVPLAAPATNGNFYSDAGLVQGEAYYYWIIQAEHTVEVAVSDMVSATFTPVPEPVKEPIKEPVQSVSSMYLPITMRS